MRVSMSKPLLRTRGRGSGAAFACAIAFLLMCGPASQAQQQFTPRDETPEQFPGGAGRDETFYACTACHGFQIVAQQGMNRRQWDDSLTWMTEKHGMPPLEGDDRKVVLDYLETTFPPRAPAAGRGAPNPFLSR